VKTIILLWVSLGADLATSHHQLESNPALVQSQRFDTGRYLVLNVPLTAGVTWALLKHPHSKALRVAAWALSGERLAVGGHNLCTTQK